MTALDDRTPVLYLAPWVDIGGADKGTIDWFRFLDRARFQASLITTQPSANRRLREVVPYATEVWDLPQLMLGSDAARFIISFIRTRDIRVVHIMNSRLGFELLPEIASLHDRPAVVVQLHVEETDCAGYVRYVTTRFGTLVDAFSVSSQALSDRLGAYEVPSSKRALIRTGVDAKREFSCDRVKPVEGLDHDRFQVLFPARVTAQKDPSLMVRVACSLRARGLGFQIHVLGDGDMLPELRERLQHERLQNEVILHGDQLDIRPWYAACDAVLLTSEFEGLPYVAYEAMAMATPLVAPKLPGLTEVVTEEVGILIAPRDDPNRYAAAIAELATDPGRRQHMGQAARAKALSSFSVAQMAAEHESLYTKLLNVMPAGEQARSRKPVPEPSRLPATPGLRDRRAGATPLVSVIVPCFNHGLYIDECLESIAQQNYQPIEVIVVDDGSTDDSTLEALARIQREGAATVLRMPTNRGPSAARNAAIERARGRYVLPLDADNMLLPGAIAKLVDQLSSAGERVGFVYPNCQFFGNRTDYLEPPSYNLSSLLEGNYCDTSSLIDREVLDRGFRFAEDVVLGHEDWDLVLSLAEHGIHGEPAFAKTLMYRKHGFTRWDLVEAAETPFSAVVAQRHPMLFDPSVRARIKAEWNPAMTVIALDPLPGNSDDAWPNVVTGASRQTCQDFELVIQTAEEPWPTELGTRLRRVPSALATSAALALRQGLEMSRGRWALATHGSPGALLADPTVIEKALRVLGDTDALALADTGSDLPPFHLLDCERMREAVPHTICWPTLGANAPPDWLEIDEDHPIESLTRWASSHTHLQCRQFDRHGYFPAAVEDVGPTVRIGQPRLERNRDAFARFAPPQLPDGQAGGGRPEETDTWKPQQSRLLCRHEDPATRRFVFTNQPRPPARHRQHHVLGCLRAFPLTGTISLTHDDEGVPVALGKPCSLDAPELLGFVEQTPLPLFEPLQVGRVRATGQLVLIAGADDPLAGAVDETELIGFIESYPVNPRRLAHLDSCYGLVGLVRTVDHSARRHRYGAGHVPAGQLAGELGALLASPIGDCEPLWLDDDGRVTVAGLDRLQTKPAPIRAARWAGKPLTWRNFSSTGPKLRASARRAVDAARACLMRPDGPHSSLGPPTGYLLRSPAGKTAPLYGAVHPVTGDQMLSTEEAELHSMGYSRVGRLGHVVLSAPTTGVVGTHPVGVPWAERFGLAVGDR